MATSSPHAAGSHPSLAASELQGRPATRHVLALFLDQSVQAEGLAALLPTCHLPQHHVHGAGLEVHQQALHAGSLTSEF